MCSCDPTTKYRCNACKRYDKEQEQLYYRPLPHDMHKGCGCPIYSDCIHDSVTVQ